MNDSSHQQLPDNHELSQAQLIAMKLAQQKGSVNSTKEFAPEPAAQTLHPAHW
jgi:hypothetical protein